MAGSLSHITAEDGSMTLALVENGGDRLEALEECFDIIAALLAQQKDPKAALAKVCASLGFPAPKAVPQAGKRKYQKVDAPWPPNMNGPGTPRL